MINYLVWLPAPNEAMHSARRIEVRPGNVSGGVDAGWEAVKAGDGLSVD